MSESNDRGDSGETDTEKEPVIDKIVDWLDETDLPFRDGAIVGVASFITTYIITGIVYSITYSGGDTTGEFLIWKAAGWAFYSVHNANIVPISQLAELLGGSLVPTPIAYLIPPAVLIGSGYTLAKGSDIESYTEGATWGATVIVGYLPLCFVGIFLTSHTKEGIISLQISPDFTTSLLFAGILYPAIFGALGGMGAIDLIRSDIERQKIERISAGIVIGIVVLALFTASLAAGGGGSLTDGIGQNDPSDLTNGGTFSQSGTIIGDAETHTVTLESGQSVDIFLGFSHSSADLDLAVNSPSLPSIETSASSTDNEELSFIAPETGEYDIVISPFESGSASYELEVTAR